VIRYLIDSSALWRLHREPEANRAWASAVVSGTVGSCYPQRIEFRRSAKHRDEFDQMTEMFAGLYPDVPVPKSAPRWVDAAQNRLMSKGSHMAPSPVDLIVAATAAHHGLVVLHDDNDFAAIADAVNDLDQRSVYDFPAL
jgi:predicted nucleic acid-binding protein